VGQMKAVYVEPIKTPLTFDEAADRMQQGMLVATGIAPTTKALALALAKTALETGRWTSMWNGNWGNIKAGESYAGMYTCFACNEVLKGKVVWFEPRGQLDRKGGSLVGVEWGVPPGHPQTRFRAYANGYDGAQQYVDFVANGRYAEAWNRLLDGDAPGYVRALKLKGYFTADEATYLRGVESLFREFSAKLEARKTDPAPPLSPDDYEETKPDVGNA
jgi:hypothetical protein